MLVALVKIVVASEHKRQRKNLSQDLLRNENTNSDLKASARAAHYANELLVRVRLAFQKLLQTRQTSRNYQNRSWLWLSIVWETHKLTRFQPGVKSLQNKRKSLRVQLERADIIRSQREIKKNFRPWIRTFPLTRSIKVHRRALVPYSLPSQWKIRKRNRQLSIFDPAKWQHPREKPRHVRGYMTSGWRNLF